MSTKIKIFQLAKELGLSSKEIMALLVELNLAAPESHFESIPNDSADIIRRQVIRGALESPIVKNDNIPPKEDLSSQKKKPDVIVVRKKT
jgi:hypothetical protein